jgi:hypothetical protein
MTLWDDNNMPQRPMHKSKGEVLLETPPKKSMTPKDAIVASIHVQTGRSYWVGPSCRVSNPNTTQMKPRRDRSGMRSTMLNRDGKGNEQKMACK